MLRSILFVALLFLACTRGPEGTESGDCIDEQDNDSDGLYDCEDEGCLKDERCRGLLRKLAEAEDKAKKARQAALEQKAKEEQEAAQRGVFVLDGFAVQKSLSVKDVDFWAAKAYCEGLSLEGKDDWRLPSEQEAMKIAKSGRIAKEPFVMWTSTMKGKKRAIVVGITSIAVHDLAVTDKGQCRVRCIRDITQ